MRRGRIHNGVSLGLADGSWHIAAKDRRIALHGGLITIGSYPNLWRMPAATHDAFEEIVLGGASPMPAWRLSPMC